VSFKIRTFPLSLLVFIILLEGCGGMRERWTIYKSKRYLARETVDMQELEDVRGNLRKIIEVKIKAVDMLEATNRLLGRKYMESGSYHLAREVLEEAEYLKPKSAFIKKDLGECYYFLGASALEIGDRESYYSKSKKYFQKALDIMPGLIEARYGLGLLLFFGYGDTDAAIIEMKLILEFNPNNVDAHFALGRFYYEADEFGKSLGEYITLTRILPKGSQKKAKAEGNILIINRELE
jgi:tetratricopeptide (TPR) repeat protein